VGTSSLHRAGAYLLDVTDNGRDLLFSGMKFTHLDGPMVLHIWPSNGSALLGRMVVSVHGTVIDEDLSVIGCTQLVDDLSLRKSILLKAI
jgi:hypothetical protein